MKKVRNMEGISFDTYEKPIDEIDVYLDVEAGTTGLKGIRSMTLFRISVRSGIFRAEIVEDEDGNTEGIEFIITDEAGVYAMIKAARFLEKVLVDISMDAIGDE